MLYKYLILQATAQAAIHKINVMFNLEINIIVFLLICFVPFLTGWIWYSEKSPIRSNHEFPTTFNLSWKQAIGVYVLLVLLIFGFMNIIIHQIGFIELFFVDMMEGDRQAIALVEELMREHGNKHRHLGHGLYHGGINAVAFALPFIVFSALIEERGIRFILYHFSYWFITCILVGGFIGAFV